MSQRPAPRSDAANSAAAEGRKHQTIAPAQASIETSQQGPGLRPGKLSLPFQFGRYRLTQELGQGAMGVVYLAEDTQLNRHVALKIPQLSSFQDADSLERFYREARTAAQLRHNNICPVYDVGEIDGVHYLTMAYIPGKPVSSFLGKSKLPPARQVALLIRKIALALDEAHRHGVVHRDLKPSNVMLDDRNEPIVMDFGLACQLNTEKNARITHSGAVLGTPAYMAPEQVRGELDQIGPRSDVYALGVMLYQFLTGVLPFTGPISLVFAKVINDQPRRPSEIRPDVDPALEAICLKMMAKDSEQRYASMKEVVAILNEFLKTGTLTDLETTLTPAPTEMIGDALLQDLPTQTRVRNSGSSAPSTLEQSPRRFRRYVIVAGVGTALAAGLLLAVVIVLKNQTVSVRVEIDDPSAVVKIDGQVVKITSTGADGQGVGEVRLSLDQHSYTIERNGETIRGPESFTITKGGQRQLQITAKKQTETPTPVPPPETVDEPSATAENVPGDRFFSAPQGVPDMPVVPFSAEAAQTHQQAWARHLDVPVEWENSLGMKFVLIPPGEYQRGTRPEVISELERLINPGDRNWRACLRSEETVHRVQLQHAFFLAVSETTQGQYQTVMGANPSHFSPTGAGKEAVAGKETSSLPVEQVTWPQIAEFCRRLNVRDGVPDVDDANSGMAASQGYRLPTDAEWELACRAGTDSKYWTGADEQALPHVAWFAPNSQARSHPVGQLDANPFGLYDILGNVFERTADGWNAEFYRQFQDRPAVDPVSPLDVKGMQIVRGSDWNEGPLMMRSSARYAVGTDLQAPDIGFRTALSVDAVKQLLEREDAVTSQSASDDSSDLGIKSVHRGGDTWKVIFSKPGRGWMQPEFADDKWREGKSPFGHGWEGKKFLMRGGFASQTEWKSSDIWLRKEIAAPDDIDQLEVKWLIFHDESIHVFVNGELLTRRARWSTVHEKLVEPPGTSSLKPGRNVIAVHGHNQGGPGCIDLGVIWRKPER